FGAGKQCLCARRVVQVSPGDRTGLGGQQGLLRLVDPCRQALLGQLEEALPVGGLPCGVAQELARRNVSGKAIGAILVVGLERAAVEGGGAGGVVPADCPDRREAPV